MRSSGTLTASSACSFETRQVDERDDGRHSTPNPRSGVDRKLLRAWEFPQCGAVVETPLRAHTAAGPGQSARSAQLCANDDTPVRLSRDDFTSNFLKRLQDHYIKELR